ESPRQLLAPDGRGADVLRTKRADAASHEHDDVGQIAREVRGLERGIRQHRRRPRALDAKPRVPADSDLRSQTGTTPHHAVVAEELRQVRNAGAPAAVSKKREAF